MHRRLLLLIALVAATLGVPSAAGAAGTLESQGRPATASSQEAAGPGHRPALALDGDPGTRWSSAFADPQWIQVDLGSPVAISRVVLQWEGAFGRAYDIQTSADGNTWTTVKSVTDGAGGTETHTVAGTGRYVRLLGTQRGTGYGYSLWEFQVYGGDSGPVGDEFTTIWTDTFDGPAGTGPNAANWLLRTGTRYPGGAADWGTGSVETATDSTEIVAKVNELKGRSGVLLWDVGNEVILEMQNYGLAADVVEARRVAYARFVNEVTEAVHAADPNHPVTSTDAYTYYKPYAPALDLLAVNSYGAIDTFHGRPRPWASGRSTCTPTTGTAATAGDGGFDELPVAGSGRYVRVDGTTRATAYGYSLYEFGVYRA